MVRKTTIAIGAALALSLVAAGTVAAQTDGSLDREAPANATAGERITVEVTVDGEGFSESFSHNVDPTIVDADGGATFTSSDEFGVLWGESGEHTVVYEITAPYIAGEELTIEGEATTIGGETIASSNTTVAIEGYDVEHYADDDGIVRATGLNEAVNDYVAGQATAPVLNDVIASYLLEEPVATVEPLEPAGGQ